MKYFAYNEPYPDRVEILSEQEVITFYWNYWSKKMFLAGKLLMATKSNCIDDFCSVHWAWEISEDCYRTLKKI
jgi:hypothetical protein